MRVIKGFPSAVKSLAFLPDGRLLASAGALPKVWIWDALTGEARGEFKFASRGDVAVVFAPDSQHVVVSTLSDAGVYAVKGKRVKQLRASSTYLSRPCAAFLSDGTLVLARSDGKIGVYLFDSVTWEEIRRWDPPAFGYAWHLLAIEPGGTCAAMGNGHLVDVRTGSTLGHWGEPIFPYAGRGGSILAWCPHKPHLAVSNRGKTIEIIDPNTAVKVTTLTSPSKYYEAFAFTPDGRHLIAVSNDRVARLYDTATWAARETLDWGIGPLKSIAVTADGSRAAAGSGSTNSGKVVIWDLD